MEQQIVNDFANSSPDSRLLFLDYDGTLTHIVPVPEHAKPTAELLDLLGVLSAKAHVVIISGRDHKTLGEWFGDAPHLDFGAEHGLFIRQNGGEWQATREIDPAWKESIRPIMQEMSQKVAGSTVKEADGTLDWHYRTALEQSSADDKASKLIKQLKPVVNDLGLSILNGSKVVTVKLGDVNKGDIAQHWLQEQDFEFILAAGDDVTDEDLFRAMPEHAYRIKIGNADSLAEYRLKSPAELLDLLQKLSRC